MMDMKRDSLSMRIFRAWYKMKFGGTKQVMIGISDVGQILHREEPNEPEQTNLCPFMRAVLFWSWLRFLLLNGQIGSFYVAKLTWPLIFLSFPLIAYRLGEPRVAGAFLFVYSLVLAVVAIVFGAFALIKFFRGSAGVAATLRWLGVRLEPVSQTTVTFFELVRERARASHDAVCPIIRIVD